MDLHNPSPTPLVPFPVCSLPGVHSGAYRSDVDPSIIIFTMKVQRKEKMGLETYHWVNRWAAMSVNYNGGGGQGSVVVSASAPPTSTPWLQHIGKGKQTGSGFNLNVKWAAGDEAGPWGRMSQDEAEQGEDRGTLTLFQTQNTLSGNQTLHFTAVNAWLKSTKARPHGADWTFQLLPLWQGLKHQSTWENTSF